MSEQQDAQMCNFVRKHQRYLASMQFKMREDYLGLHNAFFHNNHYTKYVFDHMEV